MDERRVERVVTDVEVICQVRETSYQLQVYDLSTKGCMLAASSDTTLADGESLVLNFLDGITVPGRIAWRRGNCFGLQFDTELQDVVVRHLGYKIPGENADLFVSRDRFGRPLEPLPLRPSELN
ncbi:PilZ domain-containing protein [Altererythrobacter soli]|uniref:PilZ domain-containing protein n=1 Tax=Croceibacterium soli TaxID=1739690 RepID=A0A6I4UUC3_9SPHN|nr:PilZ domain-containing protein [Croceibacterium soli]MXP41404.1 PilZ domain-containing protein [Croceibacterium soli]